MQSKLKSNSYSHPTWVHISARPYWQWSAGQSDRAIKVVDWFVPLLTLYLYSTSLMLFMPQGQSKVMYYWFTRFWTAWDRDRFQYIRERLFSLGSLTMKSHSGWMKNGLSFLQTGITGTMNYNLYHFDHHVQHVDTPRHSKQHTVHPKNRRALTDRYGIRKIKHVCQYSYINPVLTLNWLWLGGEMLSTKCTVFHCVITSKHWLSTLNENSNSKPLLVAACSIKPINTWF